MNQLRQEGGMLRIAALENLQAIVPSLHGLVTQRRCPANRSSPGHRFQTPRPWAIVQLHVSSSANAAGEFHRDPQSPHAMLGYAKTPSFLLLQFHANAGNLSDAVLAYNSRRSVDGSSVTREILNFRILLRRVVLFSPSLAAAPFRPPTTQLVSRRVDMMWALVESASVHAPGIGIPFFMSSAIGARSFTPPFVRMTDLCIKFCSSRILPGQSYLTRAAITSSEMHSMDSAWGHLNVRRK